VTLLTFSFGLTFVLVCIGCLVPARFLPPLRNDKLLHFVCFALLAAFARLISDGSLDFLVWILVLQIAGFLIEVLQRWIPGRSFCWRDLIANTAGVGSVALLSELFELSAWQL
jgi:VanZ family protein